MSRPVGANYPTEAEGSSPRPVMRKTHHTRPKCLPQSKSAQRCQSVAGLREPERDPSAESLLRTGTNVGVSSIGGEFARVSMSALDGLPRSASAAPASTENGIGSIASTGEDSDFRSLEKALLRGPPKTLRKLGRRDLRDVPPRLTSLVF